MNRFNPTRLSPLIPLLVLSAMAEARDFGASLAIASETTDNALKTAENTISERQDHIQLGAFAKHENEYWSFDAKYAAAYNTFSEDTQEARNTLEGDGKLLLGKETQPANLIFSHSRRNLLQAPSQINLLQNTDEREISTINPLLRARLSPVDFLVLSGEYSEVKFKLASPRDSTRSTGKLQWQHAFSKVDGMQIFALQNDIEFDANPIANYVTQLVAIGYAAQLHRLSYDISAGQNRSDSDQFGSYNNPNYEVNIKYDVSAQHFSVHFASEITDTSLGNSNRGEITEPLLQDSIGIGFDQIKMQTLQANWNTRIFSERWQLDAAIYRDEKDYVRLPEDATESGARVNVNYALSQSSSVMLGAQKQKTDTVPGATQASFDADIITLGYRHSFTKHIDGSAFARQEKRTAEQKISAYDENIFGFSLSYQY